VAARSTAWVCGCSLAGIVGSNSAGGGGEGCPGHGVGLGGPGVWVGGGRARGGGPPPPHACPSLVSGVCRQV
jgi:hypothetical protein